MIATYINFVNPNDLENVLFKIKEQLIKILKIPSKNT